MSSELSNALNPDIVTTRRSRQSYSSLPLLEPQVSPQLVERARPAFVPHRSELELAIAEPPPRPTPTSLPEPVLAPEEAPVPQTCVPAPRPPNVVQELLRVLTATKEATENERKRRVAWEREQEDRYVRRQAEMEKQMDQMRRELLELKSLVGSITQPSTHVDSTRSAVSAEGGYGPVEHHGLSASSAGTSSIRETNSDSTMSESPAIQMPMTPLTPASEPTPRLVYHRDVDPPSYHGESSSRVLEPHSRLPLTTPFPNIEEMREPTPARTQSRATEDHTFAFDEESPSEPSSSLRERSLSHTSVQIQRPFAPSPTLRTPRESLPMSPPTTSTIYNRGIPLQYSERDGNESSDDDNSESLVGEHSRKRANGHDGRCLTIQHAMRLHILLAMEIENDKDLPDSHAEDTPLSVEEPIRFVWEKTVKQSAHNGAMKRRLVADIMSSRGMYAYVPDKDFTKKTLDAVFDQTFTTLRQKYKAQKDATVALQRKKRDDQKARKARRFGRKKLKLTNRTEARKKLEPFSNAVFENALRHECMSSEESCDEADTSETVTGDNGRKTQVLTIRGLPWRSLRLQRFYATLDDQEQVDKSTKLKRGIGRKERHIGPYKEGIVLPPSGVASWMISKRWTRHLEMTRPDLAALMRAFILDPSHSNWILVSGITLFYQSLSSKYSSRGPMHLPFTPNHIHLISECYPSSAALVSSGPEYLPNSQELSRLTYYASNRPGKITKLTNELERKVKTDSRKAQGNTRCRASLLITLYIFKALAAECRRDISLLTASLLSAVSITLSTLSSDLEVAARAATVFTAWATYTDGRLIGVDRGVTQNYVSCLQHFSGMGKKKIEDREVRNRTRLVGLATLTAAVHSEALYHSFTHFKLQVSAIIPALLTVFTEVEVDTLKNEAGVIKEGPKFAFTDEFRTKPALERRAASIHLHIDGERGPSSSDVVNASLHALSSLLGHSTAPQVGVIMSAAFEFFDDSGGWNRVEQCRWFAAKACQWTQYQYRYAVPTRLVECLVTGQDASQATSQLTTLALMLTTIFTSPIPLINLSTSDLISSLISVVFHRINVHVDDPLLGTLVECIASLGTHVYYADQIQDLAGELISRIVMVESGGIPGGSKGNADKSRSQAIRCLLASLLGLMHAADPHDDAKVDSSTDRDIHNSGTSPELPSPNNPSIHDVHVRSSRRTKIAPEVWQDTLILLCDRDYAVRADYAAVLVSYLQSEVSILGSHTDKIISKHPRTLAEGPTEQSNTITAMMQGDSTTRFLHALHAYVYLLATSSIVDIYPTRSSSPDHVSAGDSSTIQGGSVNLDPEQSYDASRPLPARSCKTSFILRAMQKVPKKLSHSTPSITTLSDYGNILAILTAVHEHLPIRGLLVGVPMLLALDHACRPDDATTPPSELVLAIQHIHAKTWSELGKVWSCNEVVEQVQEALSKSPLVLPQPLSVQPGTFHPTHEAVAFTSSSMDANAVLELQTAKLCTCLASHQNVRDTVGLNQDALIRRMTAPWTADSAFRESIESNQNYESLHRDGLSPLIKVAPALMQIENISLQSLPRSTRGVGVTDLREALEGRSSISNPNLANKAPSISTLDHASTLAYPDIHHGLAPTRSKPQRSKLAGPGEVRDVLNKLGIGKPNGSSHLKSSFPGLQKPEQRMPSLTPPYKA
ncbi:uncharacterized protein FIBRA_01447 [Fibroporia radiculosa]|uniref:Uncharacterized protein n=1 Tax=Fibroporia radiculosa TaxID=599839 RepID=J4H145_9APHY|nr:uncharacterized protein FIBRA_01447 [Fibroporia radiculosa]CCL99429.1 predicted protein [Fibroporia radiculosa]